MSNFVRFVILAALLTTSSIARAETLRFFQASDFQLPRLLSNDERSQLGDPMFLFVLKDHAEITNVETVMQLIQPDQSKYQIFSVDESITTDQGNARRGVVAFTGIREGEELRGNVMLSVITPRTGFPRETTFIEAWGWDNHRERYNYYKLDLTGSPQGEGPTWKFRGSSENADLLSPTQRKGTCLKCHINGAPIMKELFRPWNNWHSQDFDANYLSGSFVANPWPLSQDPIYRNSLQQAERLELMIVEAVRRFNKGRVNAVLKRNDNDRNILEVNGFRTVLEGQRLLRPLFRMTEFNLISAVPPQGVSGLGPFGNPQGTVTDIVIPANFFLNFSLIAGAGPAGYLGLEIDDARRFTLLGRIEKDEYSQLVHSHQLRMNGITGRDAHFAWFVPEASHIDNDLVDQLLKLGVITPHFLAAALSVDLENPVFLSKDRESLLNFIPREFHFKPLPDQINPNKAPRNSGDDLLTTAVVAAIENVPEFQRSDKEKRFLEMLKADDARVALTAQVKAYADRIEARLADNPAGDRAEEIQRLFGKAIEIRRSILQDSVLRELDETNGRLLLPLP